MDQTDTVEFTLIELMNFLVGKCQEVAEPSAHCFPISYSYLCHVAELMVRHRCEVFDEESFSKQLSKMFSDDVLDKKRFNYLPLTFGIEECISQDDMFKFYKRGCEIYGIAIPPELEISSYDSYAYNSVVEINVNVFHRTMAKIGMLDMLFKNNPDGFFVIENEGY